MNKISQLLTAPSGYTCTGLECEIKKSYGRNEFGTDKSVEKVLVSDAEGKTMYLAFWSQPPVPFGEGARIQIMPDEKGKGLTIKDNNYKGNTRKELNVNNTATMISITEFSLSDTTTEAPSASEPVAVSDGVALPEILVQSVNLMSLCIQGADILREKYPNMTPEQYQAITSSFFIECNKQNVVKTMPKQILMSI